MRSWKASICKLSGETMTHTPPLPTGNQSPYPIQQPPVSERTPNPLVEDMKRSKVSYNRVWAGLAAAIGVGAIGFAYRKYSRR